VPQGSPHIRDNASFIFFWLIFGLPRGIGLAATSYLLETFKATVVAISRTRSSELDALAAAHPEALQIVQCNMPV
jgi:NAD(P)-dependent dehydrogenase (short-subunit alcohol dehydrogenase family)